ncbi:glycoside hydrolase family 26 protein [Actinomycetospora straminea]|uniref:Glycosyl hydrolase n=1 Tax=Actinomycetospora straminea TaxID=663607 RepID=A0ABP9E6C0_9PSEU|nr:glycosyl hydrolase [Actinomycetospora straminea]MDD7931028.1 glycosyl hydrolase [Actinomycetospora straminea]
MPRLQFAFIAAMVIMVILSTGCAYADPGAEARVPFGAFLGSDAEGVEAFDGYDRWLGEDAEQPTVGHTYLPGHQWSDIEDPELYVGPWATWARQEASRQLVVNVPLLVPNEPPLEAGEVEDLLERGVQGEFDQSFTRLGERLVDLGAERAILVLGWEMNGSTYTHRCSPEPEAWKKYWRSVVAALRSVPGQEFRFDYTASRGTDSISWTRCYPGDDVVDIIGMDSYDQEPGSSFTDYRDQPDGLADHAAFARERGKPVSFPEWGLSEEHGDRPEFVRAMLEWMEDQPTVYQTITDYCPHGVYQCDAHPDSAATYLEHYR